MDFTSVLLSWYQLNHRNLPWRQTRDPYRIWISEIILQQTRIDQGIGYYRRFIRRFPDLSSLAEADEKEVLRLWQGLGYYSRARNLHHAARQLQKDRNGVFPSVYEEILALKGIGDYTAAAIASVCFGLPYPVVDGNVLRFFSRYFGNPEPVDKASGKKAVREIARKMMDVSDPGRFNQAIMEFGAMQCRPGIPDCQVCPFRDGCFAYRQEMITELPVKSTRVKTRNRYFHYLVMKFEDSRKGTILYLRKREEQDIWKNLFDFPLIETSVPMSPDRLKHSSEWKVIAGGTSARPPVRSKVYKHVLSHQVIYARFYVLHFIRKPVNRFIPVLLTDIDRFPVPRLIEKYLSESAKELIL